MIARAGQEKGGGYSGEKRRGREREEGEEDQKETDISRYSRHIGSGQKKKRGGQDG